jgi:hypothetical protein
MRVRKSIPAPIARRIREAARNRCGYCLAPQDLVLDRLEIEHIVPVGAGGTDDETNLWLACGICNGHKWKHTSEPDPLTNEVVPLFNPRTQTWSEHFEWSEDGIRVIGLTPTGRATVAALKLDSDQVALAVRTRWVEVGWHPSKD